MAHRHSPSSDDSDSFVLSSTPTPQSQLRRNLSQTSQRSSASDNPYGHGAGPSQSSSARNPPPILIKGSPTHRGQRSTSVSSSQASRSYRDNPDEDEEEEDGEGTPTSHPHHRRGKAAAKDEDEDDAEEEEEGSGSGDNSAEQADDDPITLKERQSLINVQHPFGLPIWKPALYKKSRSVTRYADAALHSMPSAQAERHLLPGNIFWAVAFGWWLALACLVVSIILYIVPQGGRRYSSLVFGLGWYLFWPFGKYVEGDFVEPKVDLEGDVASNDRQSDSEGTVRGPSPTSPPENGEAAATIRGVPLSEQPTIGPGDRSTQHTQVVSWISDHVASEATPLLRPLEPQLPPPSKAYGAADLSPSSSGPIVAMHETKAGDLLGRACFWLSIICIIAPLMLVVCLICWGLVVTIPMARLNWELLKHLFEHPTSIRFCAAPAIVVMPPSAEAQSAQAHAPAEGEAPIPRIAIKPPRLSEGQSAPSGSPTSTVLLCTYRAVGLQYLKYTVGGVNILFVNLLPVVFFVIFDGIVLLRIVEHLEHEGKHVPPFLAAIASKGLIFVLSLLSVIPLSYFIGMAVASISAQSSIGMGAVINATFGSIIEIILYAIALTQGKGRLVEGSIVGSLLAGVLLMPGISMCSMALRHKEQKFNAKSAGVTSLMLIMAVIGALAPTLFYQTYGNFQLVCTGCPNTPKSYESPWVCEHCYYRHPDPAGDDFYQSTVKSLMYFCAAILLFSYLIGLWFSLRTHASQIWQNPQPLLHAMELPPHNRLSLYQRLVPSGIRDVNLDHPTLHRKSSQVPQTSAPAGNLDVAGGTVRSTDPSLSPANTRRVSYAPSPSHPNITPVLESVDRAVKDGIQLPESITTEDFTRAVAAATVSALRHQHAVAHSPGRARISSAGHEETGGHGGHDAPSWSRTTSASVLLGCTALFSIIAEILIDVVDVILQGTHVDEKFLGVTLFALVPNTTEFMNAISFALNGNIALSMEIGSAYGLQVCLLQIPAMVAFSAWYKPSRVGEIAETFTLIFPRWDVIALILSMFLMTYTYIEARSNYHRGSILILSYLVLLSGFYFAPPVGEEIEKGDHSTQLFSPLTFVQALQWYIPSLR